MPTHHQHCAAAAAAAVEESVSFQLLRQGYTMSQCIRKRFLRMRTRSQTTCGHRKCADTIVGTVPVPWAAHFQCWKLLIYFSNKLYGSNFIKQYSKLLWFEITKMLIAVKKKFYCVPFIIIFVSLNNTWTPRDIYATKGPFTHTQRVAAMRAATRCCARE